MRSILHAFEAQRTDRRGSSTVEFMLFMFVFIPILLYSLYITDALFDWLKAQEAVGAAAWELSGDLLHDYGGYNHDSKYSSAISDLSKVKDRYEGLDGWDGGASKRVTPATSGQLTALTCKQVSSPAEPLAGASSAFPSGLGTDLHTGGMVQCQSTVSIANVYFGGKPIEGYMNDTSKSWGSDVALYSKRMLSPMVLCGVGTPRGGSCDNGAGFTMLTDDWGLAEESGDPDTNEPNKTGSGGNTHFFGLDKKAFTALGGGDESWTSIVSEIDPQSLDSEFDKPLLDYEREPPTSPGTGPTIASSSSITYCEGDSSYDQTSETFPWHHKKISPQSADNATYEADTGSPGRANKYLGLP